MANDHSTRRRDHEHDGLAGLPHRVGQRLKDRDTRLVTSALLLACVGLSVVGIGWRLSLRVLPSHDQIGRSRVVESSVVLSVDGEELTRYADRNRTWVPLDSIS